MKSMTIRKSAESRSAAETHFPAPLRQVSLCRRTAAAMSSPRGAAGRTTAEIFSAAAAAAVCAWLRSAAVRSSGFLRPGVRCRWIPAGLISSPLVRPGVSAHRFCRSLALEGLACATPA